MAAFDAGGVVRSAGALPLTFGPAAVDGLCKLPESSHSNAPPYARAAERLYWVFWAPRQGSETTARQAICNKSGAERRRQTSHMRSTNASNKLAPATAAPLRNLHLADSLSG